MPKVTPLNQRLRVYALAKQGMSNTEVARQMKREFPDDWQSEYAHRTVARLLKESEDEAIIKTTVDAEKTLDEMSREERYLHIEAKLQNTPRFRMAFRHFNIDDKSVFVDEYLSIVKSTETLTEPEEQALFAAILALVLGLKALSRKEKLEQLRDQSLSGEIPEGDPKFTKHIDPRYQKEHDDNMKLFQKGLSELKMSRSQRLKEVRSQKQTLVDLAEELSQKNTQAEVADEIERLAKLSNDELQRLLELGHVHGVFEDYT